MEKHTAHTATQHWAVTDLRPANFSSQRIVIIAEEEDEAFTASVQAQLNEDGLRSDALFCSANLRELYREKGIDLLIVTLGCNPDERIAGIRELVLTTPIRVMLITQETELLTRIEGLDAGAEDCVDRDCSGMELRARVRAILRRANPTQLRSRPLKFGPLTLDIENRTVHIEGAPGAISLTETQTRLLTFLVLEGGRPVSREKMQGRQTVNQADRSVDVHIGHVRKKFRDAGLQQIEITSAWGFGYRLTITSPT